MVRTNITRLYDNAKGTMELYLDQKEVDDLAYGLALKGIVLAINLSKILSTRIER